MNTQPASTPAKKLVTAKMIGLFLILFPIPGLVVTLSAYAISAFVFTSLAATGGGQIVSVVGSIFSVVLGFLGIVCVAGILIGMPVGLCLLVTSKSQTPPPVPPPAA